MRGQVVKNDSDEGRNMSGSVETRTLQALVRERIDRWREGGEPDAAEVLDEHPELRGAKGLVLDLVLAEYSLRMEAGDAVERKELFDRFPTYRQSIARMLAVQDFLDKCPDGAAKEEPSRWPLLGEEFLGYELVEPLGRGGLARVYLARETKVGGRWVVVKISRHGSQEAAALGKVSHPSVAPIYSVKHDEAGEWTLICMPLLGVATGIDLLDAAFAAGAERNGALVERVAVKTRPLTAIQEIVERHPEGTRETELTRDLTYGEAIARVGLQLAEGLMAAHAAGITHRDIKPSNVLLAWSGRAMLLDFNLATDASTTDAGFGGTLAYMPPENMACVLEGREEAARSFDPRCDVYSLGAVLYELLMGRLPAEPASAEKLSPVAYQPWLDCKRVSIEVPEEAGVDPRLMAIVLKCLEFDPAARYASAAGLAGELRTFLDRAARPRQVRKHVRRAVLAAAVALVVIGGGVWAFVGTRPETIEQVYRRGLVEYEKGKYAEAVETFTQCLERRSGWTDALFARGQALRKQEKWLEARTDFLALTAEEQAWSYGLAGYCSMRKRDLPEAASQFGFAHDGGLRHVGFLMNYARVQSTRQWHVEAARRYTEVIEQEPTNVEAIRNRAMALYMTAAIDKSRIPSQQAFDDVETYRRLAPDSFEPAHCGAIVFGEAARKDPVYENKAIGYLTEALQKGMPVEALNINKWQVKRLAPFVDGRLLAEARQDSSYRFNYLPAHELPDLADWQAFRKQFGVRRELLVRTN